MSPLVFFIHLILPAALWPWVDSASNRIDYHGYLLGGKGGRCVGLTTLPGASTFWIPQGLSRPAQGWLYFFYLSLLTAYTTCFSNNKHWVLSRQCLGLYKILRMILWPCIDQFPIQHSLRNMCANICNFLIIKSIRCNNFSNSFWKETLHVSDSSCPSSGVFQCTHSNGGDRGGTVVKVLCYKSEGRWFDSRWCHWNFALT